MGMVVCWRMYALFMIVACLLLFVVFAAGVVFGIENALQGINWNLSPPSSWAANGERKSVRLGGVC